jgi:3-methyladenine DNA glycosylase AlkD
MDLVKQIKSELLNVANGDKANLFYRFFKAGPGQYGEGDDFLGITVPNCRKVAKKYSKKINDGEILDLLHSKWHEERLTALLILVDKYEKADAQERKSIFDLYLQNTRYINNWDLVDLSSSRIVGRFIYDNQNYINVLDELSKSKLLWDRRIAIISTLYFTFYGDPSPALRIVKQNLTDHHDLIQKANGWMLREVGKRVDDKLLIDFLKTNYNNLPRTTLRYAIERFKPTVRKQYLSGHFD